MTSSSAALFVVPLATQAQPQKTARIGYLSIQSASGGQLSRSAFGHGLQDLGYAVGRNILIEERWADGHLERLSKLATELIQLKVDVVVANGTVGATAAKNATHMIPIVMVSVGDPVGTGLVVSLGHPRAGTLPGIPFWVQR